MKSIVKILFVAIVAITLSNPAQAQIQAPAVTSGSAQSVPIAVSKFYPENPEYANFARDMPAIIARNLEGSGLFKPLSPKSFIQSCLLYTSPSPRD